MSGERLSCAENAMYELVNGKLMGEVDDIHCMFPISQKACEYIRMVRDELTRAYYLLHDLNYFLSADIGQDTFGERMREYFKERL